MSKNISEVTDVPFVPDEFYFRIRPYIPDKVQKKVSNNEYSEEEETYSTIYGYESVSQQFETVMLSLLGYVRQVGRVATNTADANRIKLYNVLRSVIEKTGSKRKGKIADLVLGFNKGKDEKVSPIEKTFPIYDSETSRTIRELRESCDVAPKIVCETMLQQIVNTWETLLGNLVRIRYINNPELLTEPLPLTFIQILKCGGPGELLTIYVDKVVGRVLGLDTDGQLKFFKEEFKADLRQVFSRIDFLKEIVWRRHMIVHCDGKATEDYCKRVKHNTKKRLVPGMRLETDLPYVFDAWDAVFSAGVIMAHLVSISFARSVKLADMEEPADDYLLVASFNMLKEKRYAAAKMLLEYANGNNCHIGTEGVGLALKVNLAIVYKALNIRSEFDKIVNSSMWNSRDENFRAVIAVLRGNMKEAYKLIRTLCKEHPHYLNYVYDWVVYEDLRKDQDFEREMSKIKASKSFCPKKDTPPVLDLNAEPADVQKNMIELFKSALRIG